MIDKLRIFELIKFGTREELIKEVILPLLLRVEELEQELKKLKDQNSTNSSLPPSRDKQTVKRRTNSLRKKSKKRPGGQHGHKGHKLEMRQAPDHVVDYRASKCKKCNRSLSGSAEKLIERKQVWDIPPVHLEVTEHRRYSQECTCCQVWSDGEYGTELSKGGQVRYGDNLVNQIIYFSIRQYLPYNRIVELVEVLYGQKISEGTIDNLIKKKTASFQQVYQQVITQIEKSNVVGVDESGCSIDGQKAWAWAWVTSHYALLHMSNNRGYSTTKSVFPEGLPYAKLTHDCWRTHIKTPAQNHQICLAHLSRECQALIQFERSKWAKSLSDIITTIFKLCSLKRISTHEKTQVERRLDRLLNRPLTKSKKPIVDLKNRLLKYRRFITLCLYDRKVPPDNNWTERAIRMIKLKSKISGTFRSHKGAECFAVLRTIVDSAIKQNIHPFLALSKPEIIIAD